MKTEFLLVVVIFLPLFSCAMRNEKYRVTVNDEEGYPLQGVYEIPMAPVPFGRTLTNAKGDITVFTRYAVLEKEGYSPQLIDARAGEHVVASLERIPSNADEHSIIQERIRLVGLKNRLNGERHGIKQLSRNVRDEESR